MTARIGILLTPDFGLTSFTSIVEVMRSANTLQGSDVYAWQIIAAEAGPVLSTAGVAIMAGPLPSEHTAFERIFVPAAGNPALYDNARVLQWLRRAHRHGVQVVGVSGGAFLLAKAGLLHGRRFTIHWEHIEPLLEAFPDLTPQQTVHEIDGSTVTAAGGIATFDLMLTLLAQDRGAAFSARVGDWLLHTEHRSGAQLQRSDPGTRNAVEHGALARVLAHIEGHAHEPLTLQALAANARLSSRHLERLFQQYLGRSVHDHLVDVRLSRARVLLRQTPLAIGEIAIATGYASASHFTQIYRTRFGITPRVERQQERRRLGRFP
ncbi:GlxA family transcriptional regulator [Neoroseomonas lacus]|uniref:AraC family transcriptional regulator n=1 Tax=Neoroseomonas lacus TaxID=287609 RepID=A0A917KJR8_9PROT|nr:GlxA family transcriptional regulator [Neoroseomonas lacus]GGJ17080.1 AraC family transcriptional regulator [Neoroseomonas lacus]